jgi:hypothetical protein
MSERKREAWKAYNEVKAATLRYAGRPWTPP